MSVLEEIGYIPEESEEEGVEIVCRYEQETYLRGVLLRAQEKRQQLLRTQENRRQKHTDLFVWLESWQQNPTVRNRHQAVDLIRHQSEELLLYACKQLHLPVVDLRNPVSLAEYVPGRPGRRCTPGLFLLHADDSRIAEKFRVRRRGCPHLFVYLVKRPTRNTTCFDPFGARVQPRSG